MTKPVAPVEWTLTPGCDRLTEEAIEMLAVILLDRSKADCLDPATRNSLRKYVVTRTLADAGSSFFLFRCSSSMEVKHEQEEQKEAETKRIGDVRFGFQVHEGRGHKAVDCTDNRRDRRGKNA